MHIIFEGVLAEVHTGHAKKDNREFKQLELIDKSGGKLLVYVGDKLDVSTLPVLAPVKLDMTVSGRVSGFNQSLTVTAISAAKA